MSSGIDNEPQPCLVKEELRMILMKMDQFKTQMTQFGLKINELGICAFPMSIKSLISTGGGLQEHSRSFLIHVHLVTVPQTWKTWVWVPAGTTCYILSEWWPA